FRLTFHCSLLAIVPLSPPSPLPSAVSSSSSLNTSTVLSSANYSALFLSDINELNQSDVLPADKKEQAVRIYRTICSILLESYGTLLRNRNIKEDVSVLKLDIYNEDSKREGILAELEQSVATFNMKCKNAESAEGYAHQQITTFSARNILLWNDFLQGHAFSEQLISSLSRQQMYLRLLRFSECFFYKDCDRNKALNATLEIQTELLDILQKSRYSSQIFPLLLQCDETDGTANAVPVFIEECYYKATSVETVHDDQYSHRFASATNDNVEIMNDVNSEFKFPLYASSDAPSIWDESKIGLICPSSLQALPVSTVAAAALSKSPASSSQKTAALAQERQWKSKGRAAKRGKSSPIDCINIKMPSKKAQSCLPIARHFSNWPKRRHNRQKHQNQPQPYHIANSSVLRSKNLENLPLMPIIGQQLQQTQNSHELYYIHNRYASSKHTATTTTCNFARSRSYSCDLSITSVSTIDAHINRNLSDSIINQLKLYAISNHVVLDDFAEHVANKKRHSCYSTTNATDSSTRNNIASDLNSQSMPNLSLQLESPTNFNSTNGNILERRLFKRSLKESFYVSALKRYFKEKSNFLQTYSRLVSQLKRYHLYDNSSQDLGDSNDFLYDYNDRAELNKKISRLPECKSEPESASGGILCDCHLGDSKCVDFRAENHEHGHLALDQTTDVFAAANINTVNKHVTRVFDNHQAWTEQQQGYHSNYQKDATHYITGHKLRPAYTDIVGSLSSFYDKERTRRSSFKGNYLNLNHLSFLTSTNQYHQLQQQQQIHMRNDGNACDGIHLIVCVHGLDGDCNDLRLFRTFLSICQPGDTRVEFLMSSSNQNSTFDDFSVMLNNLSIEINQYIRRRKIQLTKLSFIGHSMGNLIIRALIGSKRFSRYVQFLHTFLSLGGPHLGMLFGSHSIVNVGLWMLQKWKKSTSLLQISFKDHSDIRRTFMYKLSKKPCFRYFKNVLLVASPQDHYVPYHSARIEPCKAALKDSSFGSVYVEMVSNLLGPMLKNSDINFVRFTSYHFNASMTDEFIGGRPAHIAALDSEVFVEKLVRISVAKYFFSNS
ncbi:hypothetical protein GJ496_011131, partial [Pomphorhynchus laevis]